ncbi:hypothetical protein CBS101457_006645 [Exobasidium rhododendri]|nr:hypothetical protein CBS101457_006645 [Exobasidium rhododendri]
MTASTPSVCVFCGSSPGTRPEYLQVANEVGVAIGKSTSWRLVYGGGNRGCMGAVSSSCLEAGGNVLGVIPRAMTLSSPRGHPTSTEGKGPVLSNPDAQNLGKTESIVVDDMHTRKRVMADKSDLGFVALPGGFGTFEEVFEMVTWTQLGIHRKPIILVNVSDFYQPLRALVEIASEDGFIPDHGKSIISFVDEADAKREGGWGEATIAAVKASNEAMSNSQNKGYFDWSKKNGVEEKVTGARPACLKDTTMVDRSVDVQNLTFAFSAGQEPALQDCNLALTRGSRCLLIGANGAGKSTILRLLAGKRMPTKDSYMRVFGKDVFHDAPRGITYLGTEWAMNPVVRSDIQVSFFLDSVGGYRHKERRDQLLDILDVDTNWRMHAISDGERRRVQLTMGLMEPWDLLLLDEVTVDLDVQVRADLLAFLTEETKTRGATIIYATHIFDGLQNFPTQVIHMQHGTITTKEPITWPPTQEDLSSGILPHLDTNEDDASPLLQTALTWLRQDRKIRMEKDASQGKNLRGAKRGATETDSEKFYSKYDYSQNVQR